MPKEMHISQPHASIDGFILVLFVAAFIPLRLMRLEHKCVKHYAEIRGLFYVFPPRVILTIATRWRCVTMFESIPVFWSREEKQIKKNKLKLFLSK